ncbi:MAG: hypothetical protein D6767_06895 [Candidatus Hydrogenedentota bacterium]|nr:MAG: hypothetical protein D6767_06895 [Candidatus Hydrogenedentota bacterium]
MKKIISFVALFLAGAIYAQDAQQGDQAKQEKTTQQKVEKKSEAKFKGRIYAHYEGQLEKVSSGSKVSKGKLTNEFEISRVYLRFTHKLNEHTKIHATTDVGREDLDNDGKKDKLGVYLKYAYARYGAISKDQQKGSFAWYVQGGIFATPWIETSDSFRKYRFVVKTSTDDYKLDSSADLGVGTKLFFADRLLTLETSLTNGEGYKKPETNNYKKVRGMLGIHPSLGLKKSSLFFFGAYNQTEVKTYDTVAGPAAQLAFGPVRLQVSFFLTQQNSNGTKTEGNVAAVFLAWSLQDLIGSPFELFTSYSRYDESKASGDETQKIIGGLTYRPVQKVALSLNYQQKENTAAKKDSEKAIFFNTEFNF